MGCRHPCQEGQDGSRVWGIRVEKATARLEHNLAVRFDSKPAKIGSRAGASGAIKVTGTGACTTFSSFKAASPVLSKQSFELKP